MKVLALALAALLDNSYAIDVFEKMSVEADNLNISTQASWRENKVVLEVSYENVGSRSVCVLKGDIFTEDMWDEFGIFADFLMVRDKAGERKPFWGPLSGGEIVQEYIEIKVGEKISSKYDLTKNYRVTEEEFSSRNFIFYAECDQLRDSPLQLETMDYFFGDINNITKFKEFYTKEYFSLGGKYADTGWVNHTKSGRR